MSMEKPDDEFEDDDDDFESDFEDDFDDDFEDDDDEDEEDDDDEDEEEYTEDEEDKAGAVEEAEKQETPEEDAPEEGAPATPIEASAITEVEKLKSASPQEIPLSIVVEVGRLKMSMQTLMDLKPGNLVELDVHPESGIDLVVNGSRVATGELLQIGDTLGVRILEIG